MMREPFYDSEWRIFNRGIIGQFLVAKGIKKQIRECGDRGDYFRIFICPKYKIFINSVLRFIIQSSINLMSDLPLECPFYGLWEGIDKVFSRCYSVHIKEQFY